jgi:hypothetical protein
MRDDPTGFETVVVGESGDLKRGPKTELPNIRTGVDKNLDDRLFIPAWSAVEETVDPSEYEEGEHVATIHYDLIDKEYDIEYYVEIDDDEESE